jgi:hypothetical protein
MGSFHRFRAGSSPIPAIGRGRCLDHLRRPDRGSASRSGDTRDGRPSPARSLGWGNYRPNCQGSRGRPTIDRGEACHVMGQTQVMLKEFLGASSVTGGIDSKRTRIPRAWEVVAVTNRPAATADFVGRSGAGEGVWPSQPSVHTAKCDGPGLQSGSISGREARRRR